MKKLMILSCLCLASVSWSSGLSEDLHRKFTKEIPKTKVPQAKTLTLREQVGQTIMPRLYIGRQADFKDAVIKGEVTGFFIKTELAFDEINQLGGLSAAFISKRLAGERQKLIHTIQELQEWSKQSTHKIPLLLAIDYEGGNVTSPIFMGLKPLPSNMLLGASQDPNVITTVYDALAKELLQIGANMVFGPVTDVNSNPLNPIIMARSFGGSPMRVGQQAAMAVEALQANRIPAFNKHFPGHGDTDTDTHLKRTFSKLKIHELLKNHVAAFLPSIQAGAKGIMSAHVSYDALDEGTNASLSSKVLKGLLQEKLGFQGVIATDGLDMGAVQGMSVEEVVLRGYKAGNHLLLLTADKDHHALSAVYAHNAADFVEKNIAVGEMDKSNATKYLSKQEIQNAAQKILELKEWMGLFEGPRSKPFDTGFVVASRLAAENGVTVVRSKGPIALLPTQQKVCHVAFASPIAYQSLSLFNNKLTQYGKQVDEITILPRVRKEEQGTYQERVNECIKKSDAVILSTSGGPIKRFILGQYTLVTKALKVAAKEKKQAILVSMVNPYEIPLYPQAKNVMALYGITPETMEVAAEIILGERFAKGVLPIRLRKVHRQ